MKKMNGIMCGRCGSNAYMLYNIDSVACTLCRKCGLVDKLFSIKELPMPVYVERKENESVGVNHTSKGVR
jgi:ribosomal protein L37E